MRRERQEGKEPLRRLPARIKRSRLVAEQILSGIVPPMALSDNGKAVATESLKKQQKGKENTNIQY